MNLPGYGKSGVLISGYMVKKVKDQFRLKEKAKLTLRVGYFTSALSILVGFLCLFPLEITEIVPYIFIGFGLVNLVNTLLFKSHNNLTITYNIFSILGFICAVAVTLLTGGINSPFIFVLAIVVFSGYATTRRYGAAYLWISFFVIVLIYLQDFTAYSLTQNVVPANSQNLFSFMSILFSVYLLGGVLGKNLLKAHHNLYKIKMDFEQELKEKEMLIKEVHHRVKNNLQTVSSLLSLQSRSIADKKIQNLIKSSQNRVISMAMVHEMLYMSDDITKIESRTYINELINYLIKSVKGSDSNVKVVIDVPQIEMGIDTAIPLGLLINETMTNALKYGIKDDATGEISIALSQEPDQTYVLLMGDNGEGYSEKLTFNTSKSLGLKLIHNLAKQLKGSISRDYSKKGTNYILRFKEIGHEEFNSVA